MDTLAKGNATGTKMIAVIDPVELAIRIVESSAKVRRPPGKTARECLDELAAQDREYVMRAAHAVMEYWHECISNMQRSN